VGIAVINPLENGDFGQVLWVDASGGARLGLSGVPNHVFLRTAPGHEIEDALTSVGIDPSDGAPHRPVSVQNLSQVGLAPWFFGAALAALLTASLAHALVTSVRSQRRDYAVLRTLGLAPTQVRRAVRWQASSGVAVGLAVGLPLGIAAGALAWQRIATHLGVATIPHFASTALALVGGAALLLANLLATWPARRLNAVPPAQTLRTE
jgi:hypothetical protein